jgi:hypothetical protein
MSLSVDIPTIAISKLRGRRLPSLNRTIRQVLESSNGMMKAKQKHNEQRYDEELLIIFWFVWLLASSR